jgi:hypothetical protein
VKNNYALARIKITSIYKVVKLPDRKHPPHLSSPEAATPTLLVTVCTKHRRKILANATAHALLREAWEMYDDFSVGRYVILPDHIHLFVGDSDVARYGFDRWRVEGLRLPALAEREG